MRAGILAVAALVLLGFGSPRSAAAAPNWREDGPKSILITYSVKPQDKVAVRRAFTTALAPRLAGLRSAGDLVNFKVLANRYVDSANWDFMLVLDFKDSAALGRWRAIEARSPAGLDGRTLTLVKEVTTAPADLLLQSGAGHSAAERPAVYMVVPYEILISEDEYLDYAEGYVVPQMKGWIEDGALQSYDLYMPRYSTARGIDVELIQGFAGDAGLARREAVVQKVRAKLAAKSPEWKALSDAKKKIRIEKQVVIADDLAVAK